MSKKFLIDMLKTVGGFGLLAYMLYRYWEPKGGAPGIKDLLNLTPNFGYLAAIAVFTAVTVSCQILRWYLLVRALDLPFTLRNAFRLGMVGYFYNTLLPGSIGGDLLKAIFIAREQPERKAAAVATVIVDRILGLFGLLLIASIIGGTFWALGDPLVSNNAYLTKIITVSAVAVLVAIAGWAVLGFLPVSTSDRIGVGLRGVKWVGPILADRWGAVAMYRQRPRLLYLTIPITGFAHLVMIFYLHLAVRVYPLESVATFAEHCIIGPIGYIVQAFGMTPGGVGVAEIVFGELYGLIDRPPRTGFYGRFIMRLAEYGLGALGYIVYLSMKAELPLAEAEKATEPALA